MSIDIRRPQPLEYALERALNKEVERLEQSLGAGSASDYSEYRFICGKIRGIRFAIDSVIDMRTRLNEEAFPGDET